MDYFVVTMRFLTLILLALTLMIFNGHVSACEHSSDTTEITSLSVSHSSYRQSSLHSHKTHSVGSNLVKVSPKLMQVDYCCTGVSMICCLNVSCAITLSKPVCLFSERVLPKSDNYKSYVAYTLQRPPCSSVA